MTENKISTEDITAAIEKVVSGLEDFKYYGNDEGNYAYTNSDGTPSCLVGCVLAEVAPEFLAEIHGYEYPNGGGRYYGSFDFIPLNFEDNLDITETPFTEEQITAEEDAYIECPECGWGKLIPNHANGGTT